METIEPSSPAELQAGESRRQAVELAIKKIKKSKERFANDFKRLRANMDFAYGFQWEGQERLDYHKYVANLTLKAINQKVATLYARNPQAEFTRRPRLDYQLWDGKVESLMEIVQMAAIDPLSIPLEGRALVADYLHGQQMRELTNRVGLTLQYVYQRNFDDHDPEMLEQMKQLVRRVVTCGVGYVRVGYEREDNAQESECVLTTQNGIGERIRETILRLEHELEDVEEGVTDPTSERIETIRQLATSLQISLQDPETALEVKENLKFDFLPSTSVIVDPSCKNLKGFIGAKWIAVEYILPLEDVEAYFEVELDNGKSVTLYSESGEEEKQTYHNADPKNDDVEEPRVCVWEVINKVTKTRMFVCDGYDDYLLAPEPLPVKLNGFWPVRALTFNDVEVEPGHKSTIYPPSDVELMRHPQKERNRIREGLRDHRKGNAPIYITMKNYLTDTDKQKITAAQANEVVEIEASLPQGMSPNDLIAPKSKVPIDPLAYDARPQQEDILYAVGMQDANLGPVQSGDTATGQTIAEQSRMSLSTSNIDDLDNLLSWMANCGGDIILRYFSPETVKRVAGPGAVMPSQPADREDFLNGVLLRSKAGSSGKPNQAVKTATAAKIVPLLMQAGANPIGIVEYVANIIDEDFDVSKFFPIMPALRGAATAQQPAQPRTTQEPHEPGVNQPPTQQRPGPGPTGPLGNARQMQQPNQPQAI